MTVIHPNTHDIKEKERNNNINKRKAARKGVRLPEKEKKNNKQKINIDTHPRARTNAKNTRKKTRNLKYIVEQINTRTGHTHTVYR